MKFWLPFSSTAEIVSAFNERLKLASLPAAVLMMVKPGEDAFAVSIKKGRTSVLSFGVAPSDGRSVVSLVDQSISIIHRPFMGDVEEWIYHHVVAMKGGRI